MRRDEPARDGKAEARAVAANSGTRPVVGLEDPQPLRLGHSGAVVDDARISTTRRPSDAPRRGRAAVGRVARGVLQQVDEDLADQRLVGIEDHARGRQIDLEAAGSDRLSGSGDGVVDEVVERDGMAVELQAPAFDSREVEQVRDQVREAVDLLLDIREELGGVAPTERRRRAGWRRSP